MDYSREIVATIAEIEKHLAAPTTGNIGRKIRRFACTVAHYMEGLESAGLCSRTGTQERPIYKLTEKGWSMVGGKPFWME